MSDLIMILLMYLVGGTENTEATQDYFPSLPLCQRHSELSVQKSMTEKGVGGRGVTVEMDMLGHQCQEPGSAARSRH